MKELSHSIAKFASVERTLDNIAVATTIYRIGQVNMANCLSAYEQIMLS